MNNLEKLTSEIDFLKKITESTEKRMHSICSYLKKPFQRGLSVLIGFFMVVFLTFSNLIDYEEEEKIQEKEVEQYLKESQ